MSQPNWIELAKIVTDRIKDRRELEWKLWLSHLGAVGALAFAASSQLRPELQELPHGVALIGTTVVLISSYVINIQWIEAIQSAHAFDARMFRYYMDREKQVVTVDVILVEKYLDTERKRAVEFHNDDKEPRQSMKYNESADYLGLNEEQGQWARIHENFSRLVHIGTFLVIVAVIFNRPSGAIGWIKQLVTAVW